MKTRAHSLRKPFAAFIFAALAFAPALAFAVDPLTVQSAEIDPPTITALGVRVLIMGDDNQNAQIAVRYREMGAANFRDGLRLFRVHPENSPEVVLPAQFGGSIVGLRPGTTYQIELVATDPDGPAAQTFPLTATTRPVPRKEPATPSIQNIADAAGLNGALNQAKPGDIITLADGIYSGNFSISASGTADNPIIIRGTSRDGTILDGNGCMGCNVIEVYGSHVYIESLTIRNASRGLRFQGQGAQGNVVRRVHLQDVTLGIGSKADQKDFYICDNLLEGRLAWPAVYSDDGGLHANDDGVNVQGTGHVICHNDVIGFGDAFKMGQDGSISVDAYGNEVRSVYDNGFEFDGSYRNVRAFGNRFTNAYAPLSFQPVHGGPVYAFRNVVVNVVDEQMKFHALGGTMPQEPNGVYIFHNTFVGANTALNVQTPAASHHFVLQNNIFIGPNPPKGKVVDWGGVIMDGTFDYNGYMPDGPFTFNTPSGYQNYPNFDAAKAGGWEKNGRILTGNVFASGLVAPQDYKIALSPADAALAGDSTAIDKGILLSNFNDDFLGAAPDLGAIEVGCAPPVYGIRPVGVDESAAPPPCGNGAGGGSVSSSNSGSSSGNGGAGGAGGAGGGGGNGPGSSGEDGGCGCKMVNADKTGAVFLSVIALAALGARRKRNEKRSS